MLPSIAQAIITMVGGAIDNVDIVHMEDTKFERCMPPWLVVDVTDGHGVATMSIMVAS